ncbi:RAD9, HUS1, RAD1-interacting nuclear orphan protein 1 [Seriola lalandi dorsalis]|uniref:RAD9-HUS1-RAD1 interacting nuclear orphan 1 n=1 Tax=Seriola lalandi dorsalis TaxID=1841481 RepID=A0A3B4Y6T3_SERLL|nr:RAD9, HUS1, RAD1-interacting nuclear orphan protein 1 [Seriola lalandi dorsalis]XP_056223210.1 RAD9, HUS1, RAD1-interacting nuclear orphan protein 1 [Seriola aureovittata]
MPRKATKIEKSPLLFVERPLCGARLQNVPEVRAALNPKEFFTETQAHNSPALCSWVSPQFDSSVAAAPPLRRGRRKCQSATSILDGCSQLSRKNSVCKFPSLSFQTRSRDQSHQPKGKRTKKVAESTVVSHAGNQPRGSCQIKKTVSSAQYLDTPKRRSTSIRRRNVERFSDGAASSSRCLDQPETCSLQGKRCRLPADSVSTPASGEFRPSEFSSVGPPPDVDTPKVIQEGSSCAPSPIMHLLLAEPCTPPCNQPPDILVADTPERDYGLKVTWRRRMGLMLLLKDRGHLSDSDVLIQS